jgi:hypothetical protein
MNQKPALCRVAVYSGPGLPRPAISRIMTAIIEVGGAGAIP